MLRRKFLMGAIALGATAAVATIMRPLLEASITTSSISKPLRVGELPIPRVVQNVREIVATERGYVISNALNPTIVLRRGEEVDITLINKLSEETIIHWHGFKVDWRNDAHPYFAVPPGGTYRYRFNVVNKPATYIYHPHPHGLTAKQFYMGQAGLVIVEDSGPFKYGVNDIPLVISDKYVVNGKLVYAPTHMDIMRGFLGNVVLVNGVVMPKLSLSPGTYKFRLINASNARLYNLALESDWGLTPLKLVAVDQGAVERIVEVKTLFLAPAERAEVVVDLKPGRYILKNLPFDPMHMEMGHLHHRLEEGVEYNIAIIEVSNGSGEFLDVEISEQPEPLERVNKRRRFILAMEMMQWTINGMFWTDPLKPHVTVKSNSVEMWEITNDVISMPHPMHLHGFPMWVVERRNSPPQVAERAVDRRGRLATDLGLKDTVLVWPGETVVVLVEFNVEGEQLFPFHCHNLEHEDSGMMINVAISAL